MPFHFCAEEAAMLVAALSVLPFIGPWLRGKLAGLAHRLMQRAARKPHCCDESHNPHVAPVESEDDCRPGCDLLDPHTVCIAHNGAPLGNPTPKVEVVCSDGHAGCHADEPRVPGVWPRSLCYCDRVVGAHDRNTRGHDRRINCR